MKSGFSPTQANKLPLLPPPGSQSLLFFSFSLFFSFFFPFNRHPHHHPHLLLRPVTSPNDKPPKSAHTMQFTISALLSLVAVASAASGDVSGSCASNSYSASQVSQAASAACDLNKSGKTVGNNNYPHQYKNFEKIDFDAPGPWYEFPIKSNGIFDGSKCSIAQCGNHHHHQYNINPIPADSGPGPDRVIINDKCAVAGLITHTGASNNNGFVACKGESSLVLNNLQLQTNKPIAVSGGDKPSSSSSSSSGKPTDKTSSERASATEKPTSSGKTSASPTSSSSAKPSATDGKSAGFSIHGQKDTAAWVVAAAALVARIL